MWWREAEHRVGMKICYRLKCSTDMEPLHCVEVLRSPLRFLILTNLIRKDTSSKKVFKEPKAVLLWYLVLFAVFRSNLYWKQKEAPCVSCIYFVCDVWFFGVFLVPIAFCDTRGFSYLWIYQSVMLDAAYMDLSCGALWRLCGFESAEKIKEVSVKAWGTPPLSPLPPCTASGEQVGQDERLTHFSVDVHSSSASVSSLTHTPATHCSLWLQSAASDARRWPFLHFHWGCIRKWCIQR